MRIAAAFNRQRPQARDRSRPLRAQRYHRGDLKSEFAMRPFASLLIVLSLGACVASPAIPPVQAPVTSDAASARMAVQNFVDVVDRVEPVAEATCREQTININCDFQI